MSTGKARCRQRKYRVPFFLSIMFCTLAGCTELDLVKASIEPHKDDTNNSGTVKGEYKNYGNLKEKLDNLLLEKAKESELYQH